MDKITLQGGSMSLDQLNAIFKTIPEEFDLIDENDIVRWSSANRNRLFARTDGEFGKQVLEGLPRHRQGRVKQVLKEMHDGKRGQISIMIHYHDRPVNIAFYALHNDDGKYIGCVEVTQDVSGHQERGAFWRNVKQIFKH